MSKELKSCPFCGGKAKIKAVIKSYGFTIWCSCGCGARTEGFCPDITKRMILWRISRSVRKEQ